MIKIKKVIGIIVAGLIISSLLTSCDMETVNDMNNGIANISSKLLKIDDHGGTIKKVPNFDLTKPNAQWSAGGVIMEYEPLDEENGCYKMQILNDNTTKGALSKDSFEILPNRNYYVSALINCNFDRGQCEVNIGMRITDNDGNMRILCVSGIPANTKGWQRFEWMFTSDIRGGKGSFYMGIYGFKEKNTFADALYISDVSFIEMPETSLKPYKPGEGMIFGGSSGKLGMSIVNAESDSGSITVTTSGTKYIFNKKNNTITAEQLINKTRQVSSWKSNKSFENLAIKSKSNDEVVLTNKNLTFGVQMDGLLLATTHKTDLEMTCTSGIGGLWNRFSDGHLISMDDIGGFTVNPDIPMGTGRLARVEVLTSDLDFINISGNTNFISSEEPGWQIKWVISPGERLGITTFPPREYDWETSFNITPATYNRISPITQYLTDKTKYGINIAVLWDFNQRAWGMSFGNKYVPYDETLYINHIKAAKSASMQPISYMSMNFWHNRDIDEYIAEVKRHRDTYGIEGVYSDGCGAQDWLVSYEGMRKLREVFPEGPIYLHNTGKPGGNGGPPLVVPDIFIPAIDTYATITLKGEGVAGSGRDWLYPRFVSSQYNKANCIGILKGDKWVDGNNVIFQTDQDLINLEYNGRARLAGRTSTFQFQYKPILEELKAEWQTNGIRTNFFNEYYVLKARELTRPYITEE